MVGMSVQPVYTEHSGVGQPGKLCAHDGVSLNLVFFYRARSRGRQWNMMCKNRWKRPHPSKGALLFRDADRADKLPVDIHNGMRSGVI